MLKIHELCTYLHAADYRVTYWVNKALIPRRHKKSVQTIPPKNSKLKDIKTIHSKYSAIVKY